MRTNLALQNIVSQPRKTALALAGIGVAIVLIFMQLGFLGAVQNTATNIFDKLDFDLLIRSPNYLHLADTDKFDRRVLDEIAGCAGVRAVSQVQITMGSWRNRDGQPHGVLLFGVEVAQNPFNDPQVTANFDKLSAPGSLLIDSKCHPDFSPADGRRFGPLDIGRAVVVSDQSLTVSGLFSMGSGLACNGAAIVSENTFSKLAPYFRERETSLGLVRIEDGLDPDELAHRLRARLSDTSGAAPVEILQRSEVTQRELRRWVGETPIGFIFTLGVGIAAIVGTAIVYMVLANDVTARLPEYATLRAMGYSSVYLGGVVMKQAAYLAVFAFIPALALSWVLYFVTGAAAGIDLSMSGGRIIGVLLMTFGICGLSGLFALKKLWQVQPADLF
ncbi:MAG: ABC transporter permease [Planctomycetaceae bacterium]|nr:ABC transporter permease [Planctomycetaceae bacterium]